MSFAPTGLINRGIRNPGVRQCLGFCAADLWSSFAYESAEQKPKHCLTPGFLIPLLINNPCYRRGRYLNSLILPWQMRVWHNGPSNLWNIQIKVNPTNFLEVMVHPVHIVVTVICGYSETFSTILNCYIT